MDTKAKVLVESICTKIVTLRNAKNKILERECSYDGKSAVFQAVCNNGTAQVSKILDAALKYVHSNRENIKELKHIDKSLDSLIRSSDRLDEKAKEAEEERRRVLEIKALEDALIARNITTLFHFTRIENLSSILGKGIIPRSELCKTNAEFLYNDDSRADGMLNCSCVSVEFPNTWLLRSKISKNPNSKWALIELDAKLLLKQKNYYAEHNAATFSVKQILCSKSSLEAFENMFAKVIHIQKANCPVEDIPRGALRNNLPTSGQAEILVEGVIENYFIRKVFFQDFQSLREHENQMRKLGIEFDVWPELFRGYREDFSWSD